MKKENKLTPNGFYLLGIICVVLGSSFGLFFYTKYSLIFRVMMGFLTIFLTVQYGRQIKVTGTLDELLSRPNIYKTFVYMVVLSVITSWTIQEIFKVIFLFFEH